MRKLNAQSLRNKKAAIFSERDTLEEVIEYATPITGRGNTAVTVVCMAMNTVLENLAKSVEPPEDETMQFDRVVMYSAEDFVDYDEASSSFGLHEIDANGPFDHGDLELIKSTMHSMGCCIADNQIEVKLVGLSADGVPLAEI